MLNFIYDLATDKRKGKLDSFFKFILYLLSLLYTVLVKLLMTLGAMSMRRVSCRVISVGNITLGGTGKTSLVEYICSYLKREGRKSAVVTRGYKRRGLREKTKAISYQAMGDEPYMLFKNLGDIPVLVNSNRIEAINQAIDRYGVDTVVLDDGFQQWKIKKDLEIVTIDASDPFGNQYLLPRGILRQPISSLNKADILMITKTNLNPDFQDIKTYLEKINPRALIVESMHRPLGFFKLGEGRDPLLGLEAFKNEKVGLLCGIADPDSFENLIISIGIRPEAVFNFPDHHAYRQEEIKDIIADSRAKNISTVITTEKDSVRIAAVLGPLGGAVSFYVLRIKLEVIQDEAFFNRIRSLY